jgi:hypothetical protein
MSITTGIKNLFRTDSHTVTTEDTFCLAAYRAELDERYDPVDHPDMSSPAIPRDAVNLGVFPEENEWGHLISPSAVDNRGQLTRIHGHLLVPHKNTLFAGLSRKVRAGDLFGWNWEVDSGRVPIYVLTKVTHMPNYRTLFYSDCAFVGYLEGTA